MMADTSEPAPGSDAQKDASMRLVDGAEHLRQPLAELLGRSGRGQRRRGQAGAQDRQRDARVTPEHLLEDRQHAEPARLGGLRREQFHRVQADLGGLLDDRPRRLLALVPFRRRGSDDLLSEVVNPVTDLDDVLGQLERKRHATGPFGGIVPRIGGRTGWRPRHPIGERLYAPNLPGI